jgi:hypothetical protein
MPAGGHKTINVFTQCNKVRPDKLKALVGKIGRGGDLWGD